MKLLFPGEVWCGNGEAQLLGGAPESSLNKFAHTRRQVANDSARCVTRHDIERIGEKRAQVLGTVRIASVARINEQVVLALRTRDQDGVSLADIKKAYLQFAICRVKGRYDKRGQHA